MIPNLNFYDIYGYLIPGLTFLLTVWLPFGLIDRQLPSEKWSSAIVAIALAYIVGHVLQMIAQSGLPAETRIAGQLRFPSDRILDADDSTFTKQFKNLLTKRIWSTFGINVRVDVKGGQLTGRNLTDLSKQREDAFMRCRSAVLRSKTVSYGEQHQGMYALMRGLTTGLGLGVIYILGWIASQWSTPGRAMLITLILLSVFIGLIGVLIVASSIDQRVSNQTVKGRLAFIQKYEINSLKLKPTTSVVALALGVLVLIGEYDLGSRLLNNLGPRWAWTSVAFGLTCAVIAILAVPDAPRFHWLRTPLAWLKLAPLCWAIFAIGYGLGILRNPSLNLRGQLFLIVLGAVFVALKCHASYKVFAVEFPKAIYRDFSVMKSGGDTSTDNAESVR